MITVGTLFIVRRQRLALIGALLVGTTIRETCLSLIPFAYAVWAERPLDYQALRDLALVAAAPLLLYLLIRTQIDAVGRGYIPGYSGPFVKARLDEGLSAADAHRLLAERQAGTQPIDSAARVVDH